MAFIAPDLPDGFSTFKSKSYPTSKIINGWKVEAKDGYYVCPDVWGVWECLKSGSHKNEFFFPVKDCDIEVATKINITGHKLIHKNGNIYVRVQIKFCGYPQKTPNLYSYGVMKLDRMEYVGE